MAGRVFAWAYFAVYVAYVGVAGVYAWPKMTLGDWWAFMAFQAGWYGPLWPIFLPLNLMGLH